MIDLKRIAAKRAAEYVRDGMVLGLGTGSTARLALEEICRLVNDGYQLTGIPTSKETEKLARELGIPLSTLDEVQSIDLTIDGADEVDPELCLIKGLGGALLREKIVAYWSKQEIIVVDSSKMVDQLGAKTPLPIEVIPYGYRKTKMALEDLGCRAKLRGDREPFLTDNGNFVLDCKFPQIEAPLELEHAIDDIPGVVENGLFLGMASRIVIGTESGAVVKERQGAL